MTTITILTALYNGIEFLEETVRSVIAQTYEDWIMLIGVNGHGPTGGDVAVKAREIAALDLKGRIQVFVQPPPICNKSMSLNDLVCRTTTDWVCILDADDTWVPTKLEKQDRVRTIVPLIGVIGTGCNYFGDSTGSPKIPYGLIRRGASLEYNPIINSSVLFKKEYAYWDESQGIQGIEDYDVWLRLDHTGVNMYNIEERLTNHRIHKTSSFNTKTHDVPGLIARYRALKW
jgi:glycosyltransferase involved in cell wall biosynthesis